jgi:hypothetical protein
MVTVCRLSKKKRYIGMDSMDVDAVVQAFVDWIWRDEGYPDTIVSDRGRQFIAHFWQRLCQRLGTKPKLSTAWHPETDGQTENANASLKAYLRAYVNWNQNDWMDFLPIAEFEDNSSANASTTVEPFLATKGYLPRSGLEPPLPITANDPAARRDMRNADKWAEEMERLRVYLREQLKWAQAKMADNADAHRQPAPEFRVGDMVMLDARFQDTKRTSKGLDYKNLRPYPIVRAINNCAYELELPDAMKDIFPVFHPWLLHLEDSEPLPGQRPETPGPVAIEPEGDAWAIDEILQSRIDNRRNDPATRTKGCLMYKIRWQNFDNLNTTPTWWMYTNLDQAPYAVADFHHQYPDMPGPHETFVRPEDWTPLTNQPQ